MTVAFDASVLVYFLDEKAAAPLDPQTGKTVANCKERIELLCETLQRDGETIIIPTPALAEVLVRAGTAAPEWLQILSTSRFFRIVPFDERAAIEFAVAQANRRGNRAVGRQKAKFDDQIVAIAVVEGATVIYSDDEHIKTLAGQRMKVVGISELPERPRGAQGTLPLQQPLRSSDDDAKPK